MTEYRDIILIKLGVTVTILIIVPLIINEILYCFNHEVSVFLPISIFIRVLPYIELCELI